NHGTLGAVANGVHFPGVTHQVPGAIAASDDPATRYDMIDKVSTDGGYPTVVPPDEKLNTGSCSWEGWVRPLAEGNSNAQSLIKTHCPGATRTGSVIWQRASTAGSDLGSGFGWNLRMYNGNGST